ncbi:hypothetical protein THOD04_30281 [Vibrio owensii]|nr:hypothetical protein THOD04_30281 [Vibrio owensii]
MITTIHKRVLGLGSGWLTYNADLLVSLVAPSFSLAFKILINWMLIYGEAVHHLLQSWF